MKRKAKVCKDCGHSLKNNVHGWDQNDLYEDNDGNFRHCGRCTYCRECNPVFKAAIEAAEAKKRVPAKRITRRQVLEGLKKLSDAGKLTAQEKGRK